MPNHQQPTPDLPAGWPVEPPYVRPSWMPAPRDAPYQPYPGQQQPIIVHNHYAAPPAQRRRGPDAREVLGWTAVLGVVAGVLMAVAMTAVALGLAAVALAILAVILRGLWRDLQGRK